jgi:NAD+ kinase
MKYEIFTRGDDRSNRVKTELLARLKPLPTFQLSETPEIVIFIGGDGTFLRAVQHYINRLHEVTFIGVHTGTLGFFCDYHDSELDKLLLDLPAAQKLAHRYRLLKLTRQYPDGEDSFLAVNEVRLENPFHTLVSDVYIDDVLLETFRGNGLIVASTLGSSGYNKSLGGALISTRLETMQLTEVATLQNNAFRSLGSSLVLTAEQTIVLSGHFEKAVIGYDHLVIDDGKDVKKLIVSLAKQTIRIVHQNNRRYPEILRKSFIKD